MNSRIWLYNEMEILRREAAIVTHHCFPNDLPMKNFMLKPYVAYVCS